MLLILLYLYLHFKTRKKMETTIKTLEGKEWDGKMKYTVTLADGTTGYLQDESDTGLKEGDTVSAEIKVYTAKKTGNKSNLITLKRSTGTQATSLEETPTKKATPSSGLYSAQPKSYDEMKCDLRVAVINKLGELAAVGKIEPKEIVEYFNEFYPALDLSIDVLGK